MLGFSPRHVFQAVTPFLSLETCSSLTTAHAFIEALNNTLDEPLIEPAR